MVSVTDTEPSTCIVDPSADSGRSVVGVNFSNDPLQRSMKRGPAADTSAPVSGMESVMCKFIDKFGKALKQGI